MNFSLFDYEEMLALIRFDMRKENYDSALEKTKYLLTLERQMPEIFSIAGKIYAILGLFHKAKECFEEFIRVVPSAVNEIFQLGMVHRDMGDLKECMKVWEKVLEVEPAHSEALFYMGETSVWMDEIENARDYLYKLLETAPDDSKYIALADQLLNRIKGH